MHMRTISKGVRGVAVGVLSAAIAAAAGCCMSKECQLESVARDWCMTIRASQVIPVYPLTEDIQPGDVFLVQVPIDKQQQIYENKGFLPLDNHLTRINPGGYSDFYKHSFLSTTPGATLPVDWVRPRTGEHWASAPGAAFPSYSFSVRRSGGLNLAVPISGVPVGMSLMGSDAADGSISIQKTKTLGVDAFSLLQELRTWGANHAADLADFGPGPGGRPRNYLRVVTRVYSTGEMSVLLNDARTAGGGLDVGAPRPVDLVQARAPSGQDDVQRATLENYSAQLAKLNAMIAEAYNPTRTSGSGDHLSATATDAKTAEVLRIKKEQLDAAGKDVEAKAKALKDAEEAAAPELKAVQEKRDELNKLRSQLLAQTSSDARAELEAKVKAAQEQLAGAENNEKVVGVAKKLAALEVAQGALQTAMDVLPGGSLRVTAASSRSISLQQKFNPPLIVGYLGFDVPILYGGVLGSPIPTHAVLDDGFGVELKQQPMDARIAALEINYQAGLYQFLRGRSPDCAAVGACDALARFMPPVTPEYKDGDTGPLRVLQEHPAVTLGGKNFHEYLRWRSLRDTSIKAISDKLGGKREFLLHRLKADGTQDGEAVTVTPGSVEWRRLEQLRDSLAATTRDAAEHNACRRAITEALQELARVQY
jgi:hypothetical protein